MVKKKITIILLITIGIISVGWYGFNYYTDKLFDELVANMSVSTEIINPLPDTSDGSAQNENINTSRVKSKDEPDTAEKVASTHEIAPINNQVSKKTTNQGAINQKTPKQTTKNNAAQNQTQNTEPPSSKVVVTEQEVQQKSEQVSRSDKLTAAKIILSNLTKADIDRIMEMSTGGFTANEKEQVKLMLLSRLSKEDFQVIYSLVVKYR